MRRIGAALAVVIAFVGAHVAPEPRIAALDARIARDPADGRLYLQRADLHAIQRDWPAALADYRAAAERDPEFDRAYVGEARALFALGRCDEAGERLDAFLARRPHHIDALVERARVLTENGDHAGAARDLGRALDLIEPPGRPRPAHYLALARSLQRVGAVGESIGRLEEGLHRFGPVAALELLRRELAGLEPARRSAAPTAVPPHRTARGAAAEQGLSAATTFVTSTREPRVLVQAGSPMRYRPHGKKNPGGMQWTAPAFSDRSWLEGRYGVGYEAGRGAEALIASSVPKGTVSIYTRAVFSIPDTAAVENVVFGADYDDACAAWINGTEIYRSPELPEGALEWNTAPGSHESSNGSEPRYAPLQDVSGRALPALREGENVLAVAVWNSNPSASSDLVLVPKLAVNVPLRVVRGPYLQLGTPRSVVVRWRTNVAGPGRVYFGTEPDALTQTRAAARAATDHAVTLDGLEPATDYFYQIRAGAGALSGGGGVHRFTTAVPAGSPAELRIWVVGDSGTANDDARSVRDAYRELTGDRRTDLWLMLGDNAYPDGTDAQYQAAVFEMYPRMLAETVLWPTLGNHDGHTADSATQTGPYYDIFTLPTRAEAGGVPSGTEAYYSFDHGPVHCICLDSYESDRSVGGAMATWLEQDLAATAKRWIIAYWHHPPYSKGSHDSDRETELVQMRRNILPILEKGGVDLVLSGHSHAYERSYLLHGHYGTSDTLRDAMVIDGGDGRRDGDGAYGKKEDGRGAVYVVAGSSGKISGGPLNHPAMFISLNVLGSLVLEIDANRLDVNFLDDAGKWRDYFTLIRKE